MTLRIVLALTLLLGCDQPVEPEPEPAHPADVHLTPRETELSALGSTIRLTAEVRSQYGQLMPPEVVKWSSDSPRVASVDASGLVTAIANGTAMVQASAGTVSRSAKVAVAQVTAKLVLEPHLDTLLTGDTLRLAAEAFDANGHAIPWAAIAWTSQDPRIAEVDASGLVTAVAGGDGGGRGFHGVRSDGPCGDGGCPAGADGRDSDAGFGGVHGPRLLGAAFGRSVRPSGPVDGGCGGGVVKRRHGRCWGRWRGKSDGGG